MQQDKIHLKNVVEAILFVSGQGIEIKDIAEKLEVEVEEVKKVIEELKEQHKNDGINIITFKNSVQMSSNSLYAEDIATVLNPIREKQLTKAALETLAIIAYKQPVTRLDIEQVRGVNCDYAMQILMNFNLVEVVGRKDVIGKPLLFGTTDEFLKRFELNSLDDLPDYEELLNRIKVLHESVNESLYKSTEIIPEEDLPDSISKREEQNENIVEGNNLTNKDEKNSIEVEDKMAKNKKLKDEQDNEQENILKDNIIKDEFMTEYSVETNCQENIDNYENDTNESIVKQTIYQNINEDEFFEMKDSDLL